MLSTLRQKVYLRIRQQIMSKLIGYTVAAYVCIIVMECVSVGLHYMLYWLDLKMMALSEYFRG